MGIDVHSLNFLRYVKKYGDFEDTITIARQGLHVVESYVSDPYVKNMIRTLVKSKKDEFCEELLLDYLGAKKVDSIDNSDYEGASIIHDMNTPMPSNICNSYDTVIDGGTLEHIFNIPLAFSNCSSLCKPGGQIIHILPANNCCGHGFWQFSPELFFSLYSHENGYSDTEVFLADVGNIQQWYKVKKPMNGVRVDVHSSNRVFILVRTVLNSEKFSHDNVQQSDYVSKWAGNPSNENISSVSKKSWPEKIKQSKFLSSIITPMYHSYFRLRPSPLMRLNSWNPGLTKHNISSLIE